MSENEKPKLEVSTIMCEGCGSVWMVQSPNTIIADLVECPLCHYRKCDCKNHEQEEEEEITEGENSINPKPISPSSPPFIT